MVHIDWEEGKLPKQRNESNPSELLKRIWESGVMSSARPFVKGVMGCVPSSHLAMRLGLTSKRNKRFIDGLL